MYDTAESTAYTVALGEALGCHLIVLVLVGLSVALLGKKRLGGTSPLMAWCLLVSGGLVATASALLMAYSTLLYCRYSEALRTGSVDVIEGRVHVLRAQVRSRGPGDLIEVAGHRFVLENELGPGYTRAIGNGGMLTQGRGVRLFVFEGRIVRIDLLSNEASPVSVDDD